ncbi:transmembrane 9 superfamily member 5-like [Gastrolobium bilobum]|uniref:transmembrane 9 superfamily member 5-like n=1 Tax=Gastrolobium bilobum TaxID=150636 RepID=UPI002AAF60C4|nr:transmembrane 9 superfamily member 5-like [Gastrolobium bilobum]
MLICGGLQIADPISKRKMSFQELILGGCFTDTQYELKFKVKAEGKILCEKYLTKDEVEVFRYAVRKKFEYQMYYSNILVKGPLGRVVEENGHTRYYLFKHINFYPLYSGKEVKAIDISSKDDVDSAVDITEDAGIWVSFTYSVFWDEFEENQDIQGQQYYVYREECKLDRFRRRKQDHGFRDDVDIALYLCIIIAIWFGLLLVVTWALLRNSFKRCPPNSSLLGAFLGNGTQLLIM